MVVADFLPGVSFLWVMRLLKPSVQLQSDTIILYFSLLKEVVQTAFFRTLLNMLCVPQRSQKVEYEDSRQEWALSSKFKIQESCR